MNLVLQTAVSIEHNGLGQPETGYHPFNSKIRRTYSEQCLVQSREIPSKERQTQILPLHYETESGKLGWVQWRAMKMAKEL